MALSVLFYCNPSHPIHISYTAACYSDESCNYYIGDYDPADCCDPNVAPLAGMAYTDVSTGYCISCNISESLYNYVYRCEYNLRLW